MSLREATAGSLRSFIETETAGFPAVHHLWAALMTRGKLLGGQHGFTWGLVPPLVCAACGGSAEQAIPAGVGLECLIAAVDILDDIEDGDAPDSLCHQIGLPNALNVATYLLFLAQRAPVCLAATEPAASAAIVQEYAQAGVRACVGQQLDLDPVLGRTLDEATYLSICERKAGAFVAGACRAGAIAAQSAPPVIEALGRFGLSLGVAMQIGNDVMAIKTEYTARSDLATAKRTLPLLFALSTRQSPVHGEIVTLVQQIDAGCSTPTSSQRLRELIIASGGLAYAETIVDLAWEQARSALEPAIGPEAIRTLVAALHDV